MAKIMLWTWNLVCCVLIDTVLPQRVINRYDWKNEILLGKGRFTENLQYHPNIIVILADDMGWGDMGANWAETNDTPNLDALAKDGLRLSDMHAGASVCAPSRAALLTGRLGLRTGVVKNFGEAALGGLPANETTFAEVLRTAGYRTAMLGKWHLGLRPGHHPLDKGFDNYLGVPYSVDMGCTDDPAANLPPCPACPLDGWTGSLRNVSGELGSCNADLGLPLILDRRIIHQPLNLSTLADKYARFGENFILGTSEDEAAGAGAGRPFLLYAALAHVHVPLATSARFANATRRGPLGAALRELDWLVGRLAKAADAAHRRTPQRDTLLWFLRRERVGGAGVGAGRAADARDAGWGAAAARARLGRARHQRPAHAPRAQRAAPEGAVPPQQRGGGEGRPDRRCSCGRPQSGVLRRRRGDVRRRDGPRARAAPATGVRRGCGPGGGASVGRAGGCGGARRSGPGARRPAQQFARRQHLRRRLPRRPLRPPLLQLLQRRLPLPLGLAAREAQKLSFYLGGCLEYHRRWAAALASGMDAFMKIAVVLLIMGFTTISFDVMVSTLSHSLTSLGFGSLFVNYTGLRTFRVDSKSQVCVVSSSARAALNSRMGLLSFGLASLL